MTDHREAVEAAYETLAKRLHFKTEHFDPSGEPPWEELSEHQKEFWRLCVRSLLEERQAVLAVMASDWKPIESAPKEPGSGSVLLSDGVKVCAGWLGEDGLWYPDDLDRFENPCRPQPTHWQPLPAPPALRTGSGVGRVADVVSGRPHYTVPHTSYAYYLSGDDNRSEAHVLVPRRLLDLLRAADGYELVGAFRQMPEVAAMIQAASAEKE